MLEIIKTIVNELSDFSYVEKIILFGSRARGDAEERSDVDIAVWAPSATEQDWVELYTLVDSLDTLYFIDVVRLDKANEALRANVEAEGKVLYERVS